MALPPIRWATDTRARDQKFRWSLLPPPTNDRVIRNQVSLAVKATLARRSAGPWDRPLGSLDDSFAQEVPRPIRPVERRTPGNGLLWEKIATGGIRTESCRRDASIGPDLPCHAPSDCTTRVCGPMTSGPPRPSLSVACDPWSFGESQPELGTSLASSVSA